MLGVILTKNMERNAKPKENQTSSLFGVLWLGLRHHCIFSSFTLAALSLIALQENYSSYKDTWMLSDSLWTGHTLLVNSYTFGSNQTNECQCIKSTKMSCHHELYLLLLLWILVYGRYSNIKLHSSLTWNLFPYSLSNERMHRYLMQR